MSGSELFVLRHDLGGVVYAPLAGSAAAIDGAAAERLVARGCDAASPELEPLVASNFVAPGRLSGPFAPAFVGLVVTRACNLACTHCDFRGSSSGRERMSTSIAMAAVETMAELAGANGRDRLEVHFFGGEPLLELRLLQTVVERARLLARQRSLATWFELTTNGVADDGIIRWVGANLHRVVLSLDGPPEVHDLLRTDGRGAGSGDRALETAMMLDDSRTELVVRTCVTAQTVDQLDVHLGKVFECAVPRTVSVEPVHVDGIGGSLRPPSAEQFVRAFARAQAVCDVFNVNLVFSGADLTRRAQSPCGVARDGFIVQPDGEVTACYLPPQSWRKQGLELSFARLDGTVGLDVDLECLHGVRALDVGSIEGCDDCVCRWHCGGGCRVRRAGYSSADGVWCQTARGVAAWQLLQAFDRADVDAAVAATQLGAWFRIDQPEMME